MNPAPPQLDRVLLQHLCCPVSRRPLEYDHTGQALLSRHAGLAYPIRHNIPLLIEELATPIERTTKKDHQ